MKDIFEVLDMEVIESLPTSENIQTTVTRIEELQQIPTTREFHAANIQYDELENLLNGCGDMHYNGKHKAAYISKLQKLKPSTNMLEVDFI